jgi:electron transfer flavoprotein beta subunit
MQILVCLKQVPEKDSRFKINDSSNGILEDDLVFETNESDIYALEEALRLKEKFGGEVVVLSLGDERVLKTIKSGLAMGADRAFHLTDPRFRNSDAFVIANAIALAIKDQKFEVIFTGVQSDDLAFAQTGTILAQLLGWNHATIVMDVEVIEEGKKLRVKRELESNLFEVVEIAVPAVLTIQSGINQPRYATLKGIMQAKKKEIRSLSAQDLGMALQEAAGPRREDARGGLRDRHQHHRRPPADWPGRPDHTGAAPSRPRSALSPAPTRCSGVCLPAHRWPARASAAPLRLPRAGSLR